MSHALYVVQQNDYYQGLSLVARRCYGDETRWPEIYEANREIIGHNPAALSPGQQLIIPIGEDIGGDGAQFYVIQAADTSGHEGLSDLARRFYGNPNRWHEIYAANCGVIGDDPRRLQIGQCLFIPRVLPAG